MSTAQTIVQDMSKAAVGAFDAAKVLARALCPGGPQSKLDGKFYGMIAREKDDELVDPKDYIVFLARDNAFPATLRFYREECARQGCAQSQLDAVDELIKRLDARREEIPHQLKAADVEPGELSWHIKEAAE